MIGTCLILTCTINHAAIIFINNACFGFAHNPQFRQSFQQKSLQFFIFMVLYTDNTSDPRTPWSIKWSFYHFKPLLKKAHLFSKCLSWINWRRKLNCVWNKLFLHFVSVLMSCILIRTYWACAEPLLYALITVRVNLHSCKINTQGS